MHPLLGLLLAAAEGRFPDVDGTVRVVPGLGGGLECSYAFTGHGVVATDLPPAELEAHGLTGFGPAMAPDFLRWLAGPAGYIDVQDVTLVARGTGAGGALTARSDLGEHPRVRYARSLRHGVDVYGDDRGLVTLSTGLAGRRELSVEAEPAGQGKGWGRSLVRDALDLVPAGEPVFAAVSPGNARSLRAFLALGFAPIGSEVVLRPARAAG